MTMDTKNKMKGTRYSQEQILKVLQEVESSGNAAEVARQHGISIPTVYRWRDRFGGMTKSELAELKALQDENRKLKYIVATQAIDNLALKELVKGKW